jgi:hypothetical protein
MPITDILLLVGIIFAFVTFAAALAWGDYRTKSVSRPKEEFVRAIRPDGRASLMVVKTAIQNDRLKDRGSTRNVAAADKVTQRTLPGTEQTLSRPG